MKFNRGQWIKYSNKWFPRYVKKHWTVEISDKTSICFFNWENAMIYEELIKCVKSQETAP